ncbi:hypothetical protein [[Muricauda] lutisoli]|uniref:Uncharacterized protein n=1 Tax=[Muricauda] lutisoli TaxID=2816035 RepID=A0ABS3EVG0_9FLAO|nr:hypothetical protein [[Muricauda] lutisoli]MBO0330160.1 hypothetical protein [[Muricauda] lutisoli]
MFKFFKNSSPQTSLHELDHLYGHTICKCPLQEQISYCKRLIERTEYQLQQSCPKKDSNRFKCLIDAAHKELQILNAKRVS